MKYNNIIFCLPQFGIRNEHISRNSLCKVNWFCVKFSADTQLKHRFPSQDVVFFNHTYILKHENRKRVFAEDADAATCSLGASTDSSARAAVACVCEWAEFALTSGVFKII